MRNFRAIGVGKALSQTAEVTVAAIAIVVVIVKAVVLVVKAVAVAMRALQSRERPYRTQ